jgi:cell division protein FtsZ
MGILTVGIVTLPFTFEGPTKIKKAMIGVARLAEQVDAILVINNEKLHQIYPELDMLNAFSKSDDVVANASRAIAEIITIPGYINTDFADVYNTLKNGNVAIMSVGIASGENRITKAIHSALHSPLVNSDVHGATRLLLQIYTTKQNALIMSEIDQIHSFVNEIGEDVEVQWGASIDETLEDNVRVTIIATGFEVSNIPGLDDAVGKITVEDAIKTHYEEVKEAEKETPKKHIEDSSVLDDEDILSHPIEIPLHTPSKPVTSKGGEIEIAFEDEEQEEKPKNSTQSGLGSFAGWMRGRRN